MDAVADKLGESRGGKRHAGGTRLAMPEFRHRIECMRKRNGTVGERTAHRFRIGSGVTYTDAAAAPHYLVYHALALVVMLGRYREMRMERSYALDNLRDFVKMRFTDK